MARPDLDKALDRKRTIKSFKYILDLQEAALAGKSIAPFNEYIAKYGMLEHNGFCYVGTPDKLAPEFTSEFIGRTVTPLEKRLFQFYITLCTPANMSDYLYREAVRHMLGTDVAAGDGYFDPKRLAAESVSNVTSDIREIGSRSAEKVAQAWIQNSVVLLDKYGGDPKNIFTRGMHPNEALENVMEFQEYGRKNAALLLKEYAESGVYDPGQHRKDLPLPADIHVMRVVVKCGSPDSTLTARMLDQSTHGTLAKATQEWLQTITSRNTSIDPIKLDDALWIWGRERCQWSDCYKCPNLPYHARLKVGYQKKPPGYKRAGKRDGKIFVKATKGLDEFEPN